MGKSLAAISSAVPQGHPSRGATLREALRGNLPLRRVLRVLWLVSLRGFCGALWGSMRFSASSESVLVTMWSSWILDGPAIGNANRGERSIRSRKALILGIANGGVPGGGFSNS